jgi:hypothetical protein
MYLKITDFGKIYALDFSVQYSILKVKVMISDYERGSRKEAGALCGTVRLAAFFIDLRSVSCCARKVLHHVQLR